MKDVQCGLGACLFIPLSLACSSLDAFQPDAYFLLLGRKLHLGLEEPEMDI